MNVPFSLHLRWYTPRTAPRLRERGWRSRLAHYLRRMAARADKRLTLTIEFSSPVRLPGDTLERLMPYMLDDLKGRIATEMHQAVAEERLRRERPDLFRDRMVRAGRHSDVE